MGRLTDNDRRFGPFTWGCSNWNPWRLVYSSGGGGQDDSDQADNHLIISAFGWVLRIAMPNLLQPHRQKIVARSWDAATVEYMGRNWYFDTSPREYGFSVCDGFLQLFLGRQTHDSSTTQSWAKHLPWTQWRHVRFSLYGLNGEHFWSQLERDKLRGFGRYEAQHAAQEKCPGVAFAFFDHDGQRLSAMTKITEREWHFGEGWFKWLSLFRRPKIVRTLDIRFSDEVGPEKGSWKGGTVGTDINMLPGELHEEAFRRFCEEDHRSKYRSYRILFAGREA